MARDGPRPHMSDWHYRVLNPSAGASTTPPPTTWRSHGHEAGTRPVPVTDIDRAKAFYAD
jgi:hypothetical protein